MANPHPFNGKVIAITGGASGMGLATAHYLAERGASLSLADINQKTLDAAKESIENKVPHARILTSVVDVSKSAQVDDWISSTVSKLGGLDGAVNLAGVIGKSLGIAKTTEMSDEEWDFVLGVNLTGLFYCLRAQLRVISHGGSIVNAASTGGLVGLSHMTAYAAAKHGVVGLTRSSAKEFGDKEIRVNCVCPYVFFPKASLSIEIHNG
jgi:NAD(P)-dependent dehydrogenase (short-subunit alcohol dehydrogenase family)